MRRGLGILWVVGVFLFSPVGGEAAVRAVDVAAEEAEGQLSITYSLVGTEPARVRLRGLWDGELPMRIRGVRGAVGEGLVPGAGHRLEWPYLVDYPQGLGDLDVTVALIAEPVAGSGVLVFPVRAAFGVGFTDEVFADVLAVATAAAVQVVVAEIDSPGGSSLIAEDAADRLREWRAVSPGTLLVAHVVGEAAGVAALFASSFDEVYLAPGASIGGDAAVEDAEVLVAFDLYPPPRFRYHARRWLEARGVPRNVREELVRKGPSRAFTAEEAVATGIGAGVVGDRAALGELLGYSTWEDRSAAAEKRIAERSAVVQRALEEYDALAAMIDSGLAELEGSDPGAKRLSARSIGELANDLKELQDQFPFVAGLFEKEFPGGVDAVLATCREAGEIAAAKDDRVASARKVRRTRRRR